MTEQEFIIERQKAVERMKNMANRSFDGSAQQKKNADKNRQNNGLPFNLDRLDFPFLDRLKNDRDSGLILGLILILICENNDKLLLLALVYILL